jgi:hypothetical protein
MRGDSTLIRSGPVSLMGGEPAAEKLTHYLNPAQFTISVREPIAKLAAATRMRAELSCWDATLPRLLLASSGIPAVRARIGAGIEQFIHELVPNVTAWRKPCSSSSA